MSEAPGGGHDSPAGDHQEQSTGRADPDGDPYSWYQRGMELLGRGSPAAAEQLLARAAEAEPGSRSVLEALGRAPVSYTHLTLPTIYSV